MVVYLEPTHFRANLIHKANVRAAEGWPNRIAGVQALPCCRACVCVHMCVRVRVRVSEDSYLAEA